MDGGREGVRFCYFSLSWPIWFARPCNLNTAPPSTPQQPPCKFMTEAKTHIHFPYNIQCCACKHTQMPACDMYISATSDVDIECFRELQDS